ncbi:MAG TPA: tetratricopeptide repeat protein [Candidatus Obscuribacterales bacterium]
MNAKDFARALECYTEALKAHPPNSWQILVNMGRCHSELGQYDAAIKDYQKSIELGGLHATQCVNLSAVYQKIGDNKRGLNWLNLACRIDPEIANDPTVLGNIRRLQNPLSNPSGSQTASDYMSGLQRVLRWPKDAMPINVFVRQNPQVPDIASELTEVLRASLDQWCSASGNALSYKFVDKLDSANLVCDYTDRPEQVRPDHQQGVEGTAETQWRLKDKSMEWVNIVILVSDGPGRPFRNREALTKLCLHELGHALGMRGHSPNNRDVMFFSTAIPTMSGVLSQRDKNTIKRIYQGYPVAKQISAR